MHGATATYKDNNQMPCFGGHLPAVGGLTNSFATDIPGPAVFDAANLLREQRELLNRAQASEIRASLFLRLRLSAQQKMKKQRNHNAEIQGLHQKHLATTDVFTYSGTPLSTPDGVNSVKRGVDEDNFLEEEQCGSGYTPRYGEGPISRQPRVACKKGTTFMREQTCSDLGQFSARTSSGTVLNYSMPLGSDLKTRLRAMQQRSDSAGGVIPSANAAAAGGASSSPQPLTMALMNHSMDHDSAAPATQYQRADSQGTSRSLSVPCFSTSEDRRDEYGRGVSKRGTGVLSFSRELSPSSLTSPVMHPVAHIGVNLLDEVPAAVADRQSGELPAAAAGVSAQFSELSASRQRDGDGTQWNNTCSPSSYPQGIDRSMGNVGATSNMVAETDGTEEPLKPCPHCGRQFFAVSRWPRHVAVCAEQRKQQQQQQLKKGSASRQVNDSRANHPIHTSENMVSGGIVRKSSESLRSNKEQLDDKGSKWRRQRAQFRQALNLGGESGQNATGNTGMNSDDAIIDDRVGCPACGRRFAPTTAERHIPFCKQRLQTQKAIRM